MELLSLQLAAKVGVAVPVQPVDEVLAGDADAVSLPVLQLLVADVLLFLHHQYASSANVSAKRRGSNKALLDRSVA